MKKYRLLKDLPFIKKWFVFEVPYTWSYYMIEKIARDEKIEDLIWDWIEEVEDKPTDKWNLKKWDEYYIIINCYTPKKVKVERDQRYENMLNSDNVYLTEKEADKEIQKIRALGRIKKYIHDNWLEFTPDWENDKEDKFYITMSAHWQDFEWTWNPWTITLWVPFYFNNLYKLDKVIEDCKSDLEILFHIES